MTKRTFEVLRNKLLRTFVTGQKTVNQAASEAGINWRTVNNHITFLLGKGYLKPIFVSQYVKIYEITEEGTRVLRSAK